MTYNKFIDNLHELRVNKIGFPYPVATLVKVKSNVISYNPFVDRYLHSKIFPTYSQGLKITKVESIWSYLLTTNESELVAGHIDVTQTGKGEI
jgi:hypothetical protein